MVSTIIPDVENKQTRPVPADLRECQREFCELWGCGRVHYPMPCFYCPIMRDVRRMEREYRLALVSGNGGFPGLVRSSDMHSETENRIHWFL
jgi:hypothetical protein